MGIFSFIGSEYGSSHCVTGSEGLWVLFIVFFSPLGSRLVGTAVRGQVLRASGESRAGGSGLGAAGKPHSAVALNRILHPS